MASVSHNTSMWMAHNAQFASLSSARVSGSVSTFRQICCRCRRKKNPICWDEILKRYAPFSDEYAQLLADDDLCTAQSKRKSGLRRTHANYRAVQAAGPMLNIQISRQQNGRSRHTNNKRIRLNMVSDCPGRLWLRGTGWHYTVD